MPVIVVEVMPKPELLDPAGKAVARTLAKRGDGEFTAVRIGKRFELHVDEVTDAVLAKAQELAGELLSNAVIEDVVRVYVADAAVADAAVADSAVASA